MGSLIKRFSIFLFALLAAMVVFAKDIPSGGSFLQSLDWQKMALEKSIGKKVKDALSTIVKSNQFVVDVEINVNPPVKPKFTPTDDAGPGGEGDEQKKGKVQVKDVLPDQLPKDYILFSKLGLEAPLIEDFNDFQGGKDGKGGKGDKKEGELPPFEQLWKYNKSLDIFNNLDNVKVYVKLSELLHVSTRDNIKKILNSLKFNLNEVTPEIEITYIDMEEKYSSVQLPSGFKEMMALASKFANMIGLILAAILLGVIAYLLFNKWEKMEKDKQADAAQAAAAMAPPQEDKEDEKKDEVAGGGGGPFDGENTDSFNGVERFLAFLEHSNVEAVMLVKKWLNVAEKREKNALRALVQQLKNEVLFKIFAKLSEAEREQWKSLLDTQVTGSDLVETNAFISNQIVEDILVPNAIVDADVADLLLRLTPEKAALFVKDYPELGKVLMNVMNSKFVAKILDSMEEEVVDVALARSIEFQKDQVESLIGDLKAKLVNYQVTKTKLPFIQKIMDLIPLANPGRENSLFKVLAQNSETVDEIKDVATQFFPSALVPFLPENFLKSVLQTYPMMKKVELIASLEEDLRKKFVDIFAPAGSKAADVLELEMEKIETDLVVQKRIREQSDVVWKEFVEFTRKAIKTNREMAADFENMIVQWAEKVMAGDSPEQAASGIDFEKTSADGKLKVAA